MKARYGKRIKYCNTKYALRDQRAEQQSAIEMMIRAAASQVSTKNSRSNLKPNAKENIISAAQKS